MSSSINLVKETIGKGEETKKMEEGAEEATHIRLSQSQLNVSCCS